MVLYDGNFLQERSLENAVLYRNVGCFLSFSLYLPILSSYPIFTIFTSHSSPTSICLSQQLGTSASHAWENLSLRKPEHLPPQSLQCCSFMLKSQKLILKLTPATLKCKWAEKSYKEKLKSLEIFSISWLWKDLTSSNRNLKGVVKKCFWRLVVSTFH